MPPCPSFTGNMSIRGHALPWLGYFDPAATRPWGSLSRQGSCTPCLGARGRLFLLALGGLSAYQALVTDPPEGPSPSTRGGPYHETITSCMGTERLHTEASCDLPGFTVDRHLRSMVPLQHFVKHPACRKYDTYGLPVLAHRNRLLDAAPAVLYNPPFLRGLPSASNIIPCLP